MKPIMKTNLTEPKGCRDQLNESIDKRKKELIKAGHDPIQANKIIQILFGV